MEIKYIHDIDANQISNLYQDAGWTLYLNDFERLMSGIHQSLDVISLWDQDILVGLIRTVGDGETILYIQDILILSNYQRKGYGSQLLKLVLDQYQHVRMKVLMTDQSDKTKAFYESLGFKDSEDQGTRCFLKHDI